MHIGVWSQSTEFDVDAAHLVRFAIDMERVGGYSRRVLERVARHGEGWMPLTDASSSSLPGEIEMLRRLAEHRGRDFAHLGLEGRIVLSTTTTQDDWFRMAEGWRRSGLTHLAITFEQGGCSDLDRVTDTIQPFTERLHEVIAR